jgi:hypothetical protein
MHSFVRKSFSLHHSYITAFLIIVFLFILSTQLLAQNVFIVVIDGARYSETFGSDSIYMPRIWNDLRPQGTIYTNFRNEGLTKTCPGHASIVTGTWQRLINDGSDRCTMPTVFEYFRQQTAATEASCYVVSGKPKLAMLTYSTDTSYGSRFKACFITNDYESDVQTWKQLAEVLHLKHPRLVVVNFPEVDSSGHSGQWETYIHALRQVDSLVFILWNTIQSDSIYHNATTMFVTNDHGRHDDKHGGFENHGDTCEGCRHIMLLALGPQFNPNTIVPDSCTQIDIAPTVGEILHFNLPKTEGKTLLKKFH